MSLPNPVSEVLQEILQHEWSLNGMSFAKYGYYISASSGLWYLTFWVESDGIDEWTLRNIGLTWDTFSNKGGYLEISENEIPLVVRLTPQEREEWFTYRLNREVASE